MNVSKIKLENERSVHLTKRLNRLSSWQFFKVLYRNSMGRMLGTNFLMLFLFVPFALILITFTLNLTTQQATLPLFDGFFSGTGFWAGVGEYLANYELNKNIELVLWSALAFLPLCVMFSGGFAVIRDAFWVGTIKVMKPFAAGVASNIGYAVVSTLLISACVSGTIVFCLWATAAIAMWVAVIVTILLAIATVLLTIYLLILCSVTVTYSQTVKQNLLDSWNLMWLNLLPNIFHFVVMMLPIALMLLIGSSSLMQTLVYMFLFMVGGFFFPFKWQTHMMKTFALFHPVLVNKKGETKKLPNQQQGAKA